jgi:hypothetical protein
MKCKDGTPCKEVDSFDCTSDCSDSIDQPEDYIYLVNIGDEVVWCDSPSPEPGMDAKKAVKYVRVDHLISTLKDAV